MFVIAFCDLYPICPAVSSKLCTWCNNTARADGALFMIQFFMLSLKYGNKLVWMSRARQIKVEPVPSHSQANILKLIRKHWPQNKILYCRTFIELEMKK